jgi:transposase
MRHLVLSFRGILCNGKVSSLRKWMTKAEEAGIGVIRAFVRQLKRDMAAVENAVEQVWSNGPVEGHINRLKNVKRQMVRASQIQATESTDATLGGLNAPAPNRRKNHAICE